MEIINQIMETAKSWWIPFDKLKPGNYQRVLILTDKGWTAIEAFFPDALNSAGSWVISKKLGTVLYWMPLVTEMEGVTPNEWREEKC